MISIFNLLWNSLDGCASYQYNLLQLSYISKEKGPLFAVD